MKKTSLLQKVAWGYAIGFFLVVLLNYIPAIHDENGMMFGLFKLDPIDDTVHIISAIWAAIAAMTSFRQSHLYFKVFGAFYFTDGLICTFTSQCLLDFTIFTDSYYATLINGANFVDRLLPNVPHLIVGGLAIYLGYILHKGINLARS